MTFFFLFIYMVISGGIGVASYRWGCEDNEMTRGEVVAGAVVTVVVWPGILAGAAWTLMLKSGEKE